MNHFVLPEFYLETNMENIINVTLSKTTKPVSNLSLSIYLNNIKEEINKYETKWDIYKKYTNPYEYIHTVVPNYKFQISQYKPISRSFYKLIEILNVFDLVKYYNYPISSFHLAEGPGGFIEAMIYERTYNDTYYGMTLINNNPDVPGWKKNSIFSNNKNKIIIETGHDGTGDLLNIENLDYCFKKYKGSMQLITGDGGFDFSVDFNNQEVMSLKLIFAQICYAIAMQQWGGNFVVKVFDCFTSGTIDMIYLLNMLYEKVHIIKPYTSRYANSEKYIVCKFFKLTDSTPFFNKLRYFFNNINNEGFYIKNVLNVKIPNFFINKLEEYNAIFGQQQIENISSTITLINNIEQNKDELVKKQHIQKCIKWCKKYDIAFNNIQI